MKNLEWPEGESKLKGDITEEKTMVRNFFHVVWKGIKADPKGFWRLALPIASLWLMLALLPRLVLLVVPPTMLFNVATGIMTGLAIVVGLFVTFLAIAALYERGIEASDPAALNSDD